MTDSTIRQLATVFPVDAEALKPDATEQCTRSIIKEFSLNTSTHGIPGIARSRSKGNCAFWVIALLAFVGIMVYFIVQAFMAYLEYPTQTSIDIITEWPQVFPAVTLCDYSPWVLDRFLGPFLNFSNATSLTRDIAGLIPQFINEHFEKSRNFDDFSFPLDSILMSCVYNGILCTAMNFTMFPSFTFGKCYTFNAKLKGPDDPGPLSNTDGDSSQPGLQLELYLHRHQSVPFIHSGNDHHHR